MSGPSSGIVGVVLAGGEARRLGGVDKPLVDLDGETLLDHVLSRLRPQVSGVLISANGDPCRFGRFGAPVVADTLPDRAGPLAGLLAAMRRLAAQPDPVPSNWSWVLTVPGDGPFLPPDLVRRLRGAADSAGVGIAIAASGGRPHPVVGLWRLDLLPDIERLVVDGGIRRVGAVAESLGAVRVDWPVGQADPFLNVNTPEDLDAARRLAERGNQPARRRSGVLSNRRTWPNV